LGVLVRVDDAQEAVLADAPGFSVRETYERAT
jgi:hypothetical protein